MGTAERGERVTPSLLRSWALPGPGGDKESRGRILLLAGTALTPGAVLLAGEAALRAGAGKLQVATVESVAPALAVALPEALVLPLPADGNGAIAVKAADRFLEAAEGADAVLLGPGFADPEASVRLLEKVLPGLRVPIVLDALASAYLTEHPDGADGHARGVVLTVNPGELAKTLGVEDPAVQEDAAGAASRLAERSSVTVLCGGHGKTIASPTGGLWQSSTGGPGLGVSGSGDVQAGIVAGLLARGAEPDQAAVWGGHLHGTAGDRLAARVGTVGFLAREVAAEVPGLLEEWTPRED
ncbi:NAD(P)H-hydrate dehydratase [Pedococcus sp. 5OH_020]|uniref:NAD(P)H-hydrate dehydratase n=1 Tax=Pedococcus sp. 5OH_020 TaxID=2989814 RepID=UPI0022E9DB78|nr:NAD(P)H-hydrate dehydratase [Pedococcus sp. 5OH_020]